MYIRGIYLHYLFCLCQLFLNYIIDNLNYSCALKSISSFRHFVIHNLLIKTPYFIDYVYLYILLYFILNFIQVVIDPYDFHIYNFAI